jgi:16S rRNA (cytosine967-C5)-methyltransferase
VHRYVKRGGILVYSTCTVNPAENEENVRWFLEQFDFEPVSLDETLCEELHGETTAQGYLQLLPGVHKSDGFFISKFRRR